MNSTERKEFEDELAVLFAAFPPLRMQTAHIDAYWRGLGKMAMPMFQRVIARVLDPEKGEDKLPSPRRIWSISRELVSESRAAAQPAATQAPQLDTFESYGNRVLFWFLTSCPSASPDPELSPLRGEQRDMRGAATPDSLCAMVAAKNKLVADYRLICSEEPGAALELRDALIERFRTLFVPKTNA